MFNQHAKWLKPTREIPWRRPIASLNYLLTSHVWRQDHNGFSHQDPGFLDHVVNKKAAVVRVYLPPDANTLLSVADHCLRSRHYVNVIVAGKQPSPQWLPMDAAIRHCTAGAGTWDWASNDEAGDARCGPRLRRRCTDARGASGRRLVEAQRAGTASACSQRGGPDVPGGRAANIRTHLPMLPSKLLFTKDRPMIFAFHGYPALIHRLIYRRPNHRTCTCTDTTKRAPRQHPST